MGKYLKKFATEAAYAAAESGLILPNVSLIDESDRVAYKAGSPTPPAHDYSLDYLTLEILENGTITFVDSYGQTSDPFSLYSDGAYYSLNNGTTWTQFEYDGDLYGGDGGIVPVSVHANDKMLIKAVRTEWANDSSGNMCISATCDFNAAGNAMSLIWGDNFVGQTDFENGEDESNWGYRAFEMLFQDNTHLISAENLILPVLDLTIGDSAYSNMFYNCTSLTTSPVISATVLGTYSCISMFKGCTSLNNITCLATTLDENSNSFWVDGVAASGTFTKAASMNDWTTGVNGIPEGWTVVNA